MWDQEFERYGIAGYITMLVFLRGRQNLPENYELTFNFDDETCASRFASTTPRDRHNFQRECGVAFLIARDAVAGRREQPARDNFYALLRGSRYWSRVNSNPLDRGAAIDAVFTQMWGTFRDNQHLKECVQNLVDHFHQHPQDRYGWQELYPILNTHFEFPPEESGFLKM